jgi:hypothetical protein
LSSLARWKLDNRRGVVHCANDGANPDEELAVDINGAKALKERLGQNGADEAPPAAEPAEVPADAPPVYHWTGKMPPKPAPAGEDSAPGNASLFSRLSLSFR